MTPLIPGTQYIYLIKTNAEGDTIWTRTLGESGCSNFAWSVQQTYDGGYIITGRTNFNNPISHDLYLIKTDTYGDTIWTRTYEESVGYCVRQTYDNGYIIAGYTGLY